MTAAQHVENLLQFLVAGVLIGVIYGLMCVGLSIIFGVMRVELVWASSIWIESSRPLGPITPSTMPQMKKD
jgi:hypothetical protein